VERVVGVECEKAMVRKDDLVDRVDFVEFDGEKGDLVVGRARGASRDCKDTDRIHVIGEDRPCSGRDRNKDNQVEDVPDDVPGGNGGTVIRFATPSRPGAHRIFHFDHVDGNSLIVQAYVFSRQED